MISNKRADEIRRVIKDRLASGFNRALVNVLIDYLEELLADRAERRERERKLIVLLERTQNEFEWFDDEDDEPGLLVDIRNALSQRENNNE